MLDFETECAMTLPHLGDVIVHALTYSERRKLFAEIDSDDERSEEYQTQFMLILLTECVRKPNGEHCGSASDWDKFAGRHTDEALEVFNKACELNGFRPEVVEGN